jgi:hypothetical protein
MLTFEDLTSNEKSVFLNEVDQFTDIAKLPKYLAVAHCEDVLAELCFAVVKTIKPDFDLETVMSEFVNYFKKHFNEGTANKFYEKMLTVF